MSGWSEPVRHAPERFAGESGPRDREHQVTQRAIELSAQERRRATEAHA